jgi:outer membrane lipoprotein-sorting protein
VNEFLRTASTRRLLGAIAAVILAVAAGATIAIAATGGGPVPREQRLASAIHQALTAGKVAGISADIKFTNRLINSSQIEGSSDPLLNGGSGHIWVSSSGQLRLELYGDNGDPAVVVDKTSWWVSDPSSQTVYEGTLPKDVSTQHKKAKHDSTPTIAQIQADLNRLAKHVVISKADPTDLAGQPTYRVRMSPKHDRGLIGQAELAWDAIHGVPLKVGVYARGDNTPVLALEATGITYGAVDSSIFSISPPSGYKVVKVTSSAGKGGGRTGRHAHAAVAGVAAVAKRVPFRLRAPAKLAGLQRESATVLGSSHPTALITYGQGLGGIAVLEQASDRSSARAQPKFGSGTDGTRLTLPSVRIGRATGQELDTALGTVIRFTRGGVTYTVIGSVTPRVADSAAKAL